MYWSRYGDRARIAESQHSTAGQAEAEASSKNELLAVLESRRQATGAIGVKCERERVPDIAGAEALFLEAMSIEAILKGLPSRCAETSSLRLESRTPPQQSYGVPRRGEGPSRVECYMCCKKPKIPRVVFTPAPASRGRRRAPWGFHAPKLPKIPKAPEPCRAYAPFQA
jgi:hypothetical protein